MVHRLTAAQLGGLAPLPCPLADAEALTELTAPHLSGLPPAERNLLLMTAAALHASEEPAVEAQVVARAVRSLADAGTDAAEEWWDLAAETTLRLLTARPTPEGARLTALVLGTCPPSRAAGLHQRVRAALGQAPTAAAVDLLLPAPPAQGQAGRAGKAVEPPASWLRVWAWSPVLPAPLLAGFGPLLAALRRIEPGGPPDPRTTARPRSRHHTALALEDLRERTAAAGPLAAAAALAGAPDAGASGYAMVLQRLVGADPAAWTADVPAVLAALVLPQLGAFYLAAAAVAARCPKTFPAGHAEAVLAALTLSRALPAPADPHVPEAAECAGRAWSGLLTFVWSTGADLEGDLPAVLDHLRTLAEPLTRRPAALPAEAAPPATSTAGRSAQDEGELPADLP